MTIADVKSCLLINLRILKTREILVNKTDMFEENWNIFYNRTKS